MTTDVEALVAEGKYMELIGNGPINILAGKLADALERQQAVVEAAQGLASHPGLQRWAANILRRPLAALDAPQEGDGT